VCVREREINPKAKKLTVNAQGDDLQILPPPNTYHLLGPLKFLLLSMSSVGILPLWPPKQRNKLLWEP